MDNMSGQSEFSSGWTYWTNFLRKLDKCRNDYKKVEKILKNMFDEESD